MPKHTLRLLLFPALFVAGVVAFRLIGQGPDTQVLQGAELDAPAHEPVPASDQAAVLDQTSATEPVSASDQASATEPVSTRDQASAPSLISTTLLTPQLRELEPFELTSLDGTSWNRASLDGKPWIINFWAGWCPPCIKELPSLNRAWQQLEPAGVGMVAINIGEDADVVQAFLKKVAIDFPVVLGDPVNSMSNWQVRTLPTTYIVDANGNIVYEALGEREWDDEDIITAVLALIWI